MVKPQCNAVIDPFAIPIFVIPYRKYQTPAILIETISLVKKQIQAAQHDFYLLVSFFPFFKQRSCFYVLLFLSVGLSYSCQHSSFQLRNEVFYKKSVYNTFRPQMSFLHIKEFLINVGLILKNIALHGNNMF